MAIVLRFRSHSGRAPHRFYMAFNMTLWLWQTCARLQLLMLFLKALPEDLHDEKPLRVRFSYSSLP
jgi:hypothetical protein